MSRPGHAASVATSRFRRHLPVYALLLPGLLLYAAWVAFPLIQSFVMSFTDWRLRGESHFLGLDNYTRALGDPMFLRALMTTIGYTVVTVTGQMILGLGAALLLNQGFRGRGVLRLVYYLPVITSWVIVSLVFVWLYNGQSGVLNWLLHDALGIIGKDVAWLAEPSTAIWAIAVLGIWKGVGWAMVIFLAGLHLGPRRAPRSGCHGRRQRLGTLPECDPAVPAPDHHVPDHRAHHRWLLRVHQHLRDVVRGDRHGRRTAQQHGRGPHLHLQAGVLEHRPWLRCRVVVHPRRRHRRGQRRGAAIRAPRRCSRDRRRSARPDRCGSSPWRSQSRSGWS